MSQEKVRKEKRLRLVLSDDIKEGKAKMNEKIANELGIADKLEAVVGGKKKIVFNVILSSEVPPEQVIINTSEAKTYGIANNTIATIRRPLSS
jgi:hypothetical protein